MKSNLTIKQQKLVRTPAFKKWFGDWENSPQIASKVVDENGEPLVVYHGSNQNDIISFNVLTTKHIGSFFTDNKQLAKKYGKNIYPVFLDIKNPRVFNAEFSNYHDDQTYYDYKIQEAFYETDNDGYKKYDGFRYINFYDSPRKGDTPILNNGLVVFSSEQIKLADGTNVSFDINNADIRYNGGGLIGNGIFTPLGTVKELGITPEILEHDMIAKCDCGEKFSYQNSKKNILWQCPECNGMKRIKPS